MEAKNSRALLLIVSTFTYLLVGAAVFGRLEHHADLELREQLDRIRESLQRKYEFSEEDLALFHTVVINSIPHKAGYQWSFAGAFYFATGLITTIGYGHSAPDTNAGKLFCIVYALLGIPMGLIMFQSIGERVNTFIAFCLNLLRKKALSSGLCKTLPEVSVHHLLFVSLTFGQSIIVLGTYIFHREEKWTIFEAFYFCVITLSTIGFGDLVALQHKDGLHRSPAYIIFTLLFILVGLSVFSACVNLLVVGVLARNADEVSAQTREPPKSVIFEHFAMTTSNVNLFGLRKISKEPNAAEENKTEKTRGSVKLSVQEKDIYVRKGKNGNDKDNSFATSICFICNLPKKEKKFEKVPFSVRLRPTPNIEHLIYEEFPVPYIAPITNGQV